MMRGLSGMFASLMVGLAAWPAAADSPPGKIPVLISILEQAEVPAREAGVLIRIDVQEGARVDEGAQLAQIDDTEAAFLQQRAKLEMEIAAKNAANDLAVQTAEKTRDVAVSIYQRTNEGAQKFRNSISQTELDRLQLEAAKAELELRQAQHEQEIEKVTAQLKQVEYEFACRHVERRKISAPFSGVVVEVNRRRGEWVEPGNKVLRLVRMDRLRAEGFLDARQAKQELAGAPVSVSVESSENELQPLAGKIVFVSPEVDPVNGQVRVLAEVENPGLTLRPGVRASLEVRTP